MAQRRSKASPPPASYSAAASELLTKIRNLRADIPGFTQPENAAATRKVIANASFPDEFLEMVSVTVQSSPALASASGLSPDAIRETVRFSAAYTPVADELEALARAVRHTISVRRANAAQESLAAYDLAKGFARKSGGADLAARVAEIKKTIKRGGKKKTAPKSAQT